MAEDKLLETAQGMAQAVAKRNTDIVKLVKDMQHKGQSYDVPGAIKYELDIAAKAYEAMGKQSAHTKKALTGAFAARSKM